MGADDMVMMLQHYFQPDKLTAAQRGRVRDLVEGSPETRARPKLQLTPAQVEQLTAEHETIDGMLADLERRAAATAAAATVGVVSAAAGNYHQGPESDSPPPTANAGTPGDGDDEHRATITFGM